MNMNAVIDAHMAYLPMLDRAAECVMAMGYTPGDCLLEHHTDWVDDEQVVRRILKVLGEPCFEVVTHQSPWADYKCTVTHTPRLIAWPPLRPMTAHQVPRSSMGGST